MRVYIPATFSQLAELTESKTLRPSIAFAATPAYARELGATNMDPEDVEYQALYAAADACIDLLREDSARVPLRLVIAADVDAVDEIEDAPGCLTLREPIPLDQVASLHVDDDTQEVRRAVNEALSQDSDAQALRDVDLLWFDVSEAGTVLAFVQ